MWFKCVSVIVLASAVLLVLCKGECQQAEDYPVFVDDGEYLCGIQYPVINISFKSLAQSLL